MKKFLSIVTALVMLVSLVAVSVSAEEDATYLPVCGDWSYDAESGVLSGGKGENGQYHATTWYYIENGAEATISIDMKYDALTTECGAGLFFDVASPEESFGIDEGMGVMTWFYADGQQFKTWSWDQTSISTTNPGWGDYWNEVANMAKGDTETVYTITAVITTDTIECTLKNNTTGAEHVLQEGAIELINNADGLYVGVIALNCAASFSNLKCDIEELPEVTTETPATEESTTADTETSAETTTEGTDTEDTTVTTDSDTDAKVETSDKAEEPSGGMNPVIPIVIVAVIVVAVVVVLVIKKAKK